MYRNPPLTVFNNHFAVENHDSGRALASSKLVSLCFNSMDENINIDSSSLGKL